MTNSAVKNRKNTKVFFWLLAALTVFAILIVTTQISSTVNSYRLSAETIKKYEEGTAELKSRTDQLTSQLNSAQVKKFQTDSYFTSNEWLKLKDDAYKRYLNENLSFIRTQTDKAPTIEKKLVALIFNSTILLPLPLSKEYKDYQETFLNYALTLTLVDTCHPEPSTSKRKTVELLYVFLFIEKSELALHKVTEVASKSCD